VRLVAIYFTLVLFAGLSAILAQPPSPSATYTEAISADALISAFQGNPIVANAKYMGHRMSVGGMVDRIGMDKGNAPFVVLRPINRQASGSIKRRFAPAITPRIAQLRLDPGSTIAPSMG
jgi:tRNA_anti-like